MEDGTPKISGPMVNQNNTFEEDGSQKNDLPNSLADDVLPHVGSNQTLESWIWFSLKKVFSWRLSGQGQRGEGIHDEVDPQHLNWVQGRFSQNSTSDEGHNQSDEVDCQLELQELSDGVEDVSAPLHSSDDWAEVIIKQNDAWGFLGDFSTSNTHGETDISLFESGSVIGSITSHGDNV